MAGILEICQDAAALVATQKPQSLFDTSSQHNAIFLSIARSTLNSLRRFGDWQELTKEGVLKTHANKSVYYIKDFCSDFFCLVHNTIYVKDKTEKVIGALSPQQYMRERYFDLSHVGVKFKIQNGRFVFLSQPEEGLKIVFNYRSANVCYDPTCEFCENPEKDYFIKELDLSDIIHRVLLKYRVYILDEKISVEVNHLEKKIYSDEKWLIFIISQVIQNSIKYMNKKDKKIEIDASENKDNVILSIKDNGCGIKDGDLARVFEKGFTGSDRTKSKSTGIGLYLSKKICNKLGLEINIYSKYKEWTKIEIIYPKSNFNKMD